MKTLSIAWILDVLGLVLMLTKRRRAVHGSGRLARRAAFAMLLLAMLGVAGCATGARIGTGAFSQECGPGVGPCVPGLVCVDCGMGATCAVPPVQCCGGGVCGGGLVCVDCGMGPTCAVPPVQCCGGGVCGGGLVCSQTTSGPQCVTPGPGVGGASQPPPLQPFPGPPPQIGPPPIVYPPVPSFRAEEFASSASCPAGPLRSATAGDGGRGRAGRRIGEIKALLPALLRPRCRGGASLQWQPD